MSRNDYKEYITVKRVIYKVYEVSYQHQRGKLLKTYMTERLAKKFMEKSIYRFIKEDIMIYEKEL